MGDELFPAPPVPREAVAGMQTAATAARLAGHQLSQALLYGGRWNPETVQEVVRLLNALAAIQGTIERLVAASREPEPQKVSELVRLTDRLISLHAELLP